MQSNKKRGLGRGLNDMGINELLTGFDSHPVTNAKPVSSGELRYVSTDMLQPGRYQPRKNIDSEALQDLANSIRAQGIIQPIVVRRLNNGFFEIIAGERRWRASQLAELAEVPVVIREINDEAAVAMALIENIQREDLNPVEEATALQRLIDEFQLTQQEIAKAIGKSRTTVTNLLRLLVLPTDVRTMLERGDLDMGHAKVIMTLPEQDQLQIARTITSKGLSVRETEKLAQRIKAPHETVTKTVVDPHIQQLQTRISEKLAATVAIQHSAKGKGKLVIQYHNLDELDGILRHIGIEQI